MRRFEIILLAIVCFAACGFAVKKFAPEQPKESLSRTIKTFKSDPLLNATKWSAAGARQYAHDQAMMKAQLWMRENPNAAVLTISPPMIEGEGTEDDPYEARVTLLARP